MANVNDKFFTPNESFVKLYKALFQSPEFETPIEILLYSIILNYPENTYSGRQEVLARYCKVKDLRTIRKMLRSLEKKGLLRITSCRGKYGAFRSYTILRRPLNDKA